MVIVEFLRPWGAYNAGDKAGFEQRLVDELVSSNYVKVCAKQPARQQAAAPAKPEADKAMKSPQRGK